MNTSNWKSFRVGEIFDLVPTKGIDSTELLPGNDISYIGAKKDDNGLMMRCQLSGFEDWVSKGNCIVFICLGAGSAGYATYQGDDFIGMSGKTLCGYNDNLNEFNGNFIATVLSCERPKYSFGRSWTGDRLKNTLIKLPVDTSGHPDWHYMEEYMKSLHSKTITTSVKSSHIPLETEKWGKFMVGDLFTQIYKAEAHTKDDYDSAESITSLAIPYVSRTNTNNGVDGFIVDNPTGIESGNAIIIGDTTATVSYQKDEFICGDHIVVLRAKWLNEYTGLFVTCILRKEQYRYSYGRAFVMSSIANTDILLPQTPSGEPDWKWMENYMKSLPFSDKIAE